MEPLATWIVALILSVAPVGRITYKHSVETREETETRYRAIADDLVNIVYDPEMTPLFSGPYGRTKTLLLLVSIFNHESDFRKDVDLGVGPKARGDAQQSWCLGQVNLGEIDKHGQQKQRIYVAENGHFAWAKKDDPRGWSGPDLVQDRTKCIRAVISMVRTSLSACSRHLPDHRLSLYASGECGNYGAGTDSDPMLTPGMVASEKRIKLAKKLFEKNRKLIQKDEAILAAIQKDKASKLNAGAPSARPPLMASTP